MMRALILLLLLSGCSSTFNGVCAVRPIGQNEQGITFLATQCEATQ